MLEPSSLPKISGLCVPVELALVPSPPWCGSCSSNTATSCKWQFNLLLKKEKPQHNQSAIADQHFIISFHQGTWSVYQQRLRSMPRSQHHQPMERQPLIGYYKGSSAMMGHETHHCEPQKEWHQVRRPTVAPSPANHLILPRNANNYLSVDWCLCTGIQYLCLDTSIHITTKVKSWAKPQFYRIKTFKNLRWYTLKATDEIQSQESVIITTSHHLLICHLLTYYLLLWLKLWASLAKFL